jgi:hypothetical protein
MIGRRRVITGADQWQRQREAEAAQMLTAQNY